MQPRANILFLLLLLNLAALPGLAQQYKVKSKDGVVKVQDKSKPVRVALEKQYAKMVQAYFDDDPEPILALRTPDFTAQPPDGPRWTSEDARAYIMASFEQVERTIELSFDIETIEVEGDTAKADIHQQWKRMQRKAGQLRTVETEARQREWWLNTPEGWRLFFIDDVQRGVWKVDGKRVDPSKPYDPDAPPFEPDER